MAVHTRLSLSEEGGSPMQEQLRAELALFEKLYDAATQVCGWVAGVPPGGPQCAYLLSSGMLFVCVFMRTWQRRLFSVGVPRFPRDAYHQPLPPAACARSARPLGPCPPHAHTQPASSNQNLLYAFNMARRCTDGCTLAPLFNSLVCVRVRVCVCIVCMC